jgi:Pyruvate/2-oxoacid:ferredoxin oxidoreductase delta subunit
MARPIWFVNLLKKAFPLRFQLARMTRLPGFGELVDRVFFRGDDMVYLPIDHPISVHENLDQPVEIILPSRIVDHFIERAQYHWIMNFCICRESKQCTDYPWNFGCIFLGEAVLKINPRLGRLASKEETFEHVRRCREAGLVHVIGRNKLDVMWLGAGPGDKLMTICNCCPCCCLLKILPEINPRIGTKVNRLPDVEVKVSERCLGCGTCTQGICFVDAIQLVDGQAQIGPECRGCGRCVDICPNEAIEIALPSEKRIDETIRRISWKVDVE